LGKAPATPTKNNNALMPPRCRKETWLAFAISLLPALGVLAALLTGHRELAALLFISTFGLIVIGTLVPRCAWFGPLICSLPVGSDGVCLTIDDGPDPEHTLALLDLLDQHQAKAIFFLIGDRSARHPELVREIAKRGHLIGNHSQTHPAATFWALGPWRMWAEIAGCQQTLTQITATAPRWFRPPVGHHNLFVAAPLRALGLKMLMWNCRGYDAVEKNPALVLRRLEKDLRPGAILLLHDATPICEEVLGSTLAMLQQRGLRVQVPSC
jgi:peptidoglycan-N-acetylglucosamine deacetylase